MKANHKRLFLADEQESHMDRPHAILSGSQAERFMTCPGSVMLSKGIVSKSSDAADEGTLAHTVAELMFRQLTRKKKLTFPEIPAHYDKNMMDDCRSYVEEVMLLEGELHIEVVLDFKGLHKDLGGTSDLVNIDRAKRILRVGDLKYGRTQVKAAENAQLLTYAVGACETFDLYDEIDTIELHIFQPRGKNSSWSCDMKYLLEFKEKLVAAAHLSDDPFAPLVMTDKGCYWCKAKSRCPEFAKVAKKSAAEDFKLPVPKKETPAAFEPVKLPEMLALAAQLAPWCEAVFLQAKESLAEDAASIPGWGLKPGRSMTSWEDTDKAMELVQKAIEDMSPDLRERMLDALIVKPSVVSPSKAEAALAELELYCEEHEDLEGLAQLREALGCVTESKRAASSLARISAKAKA
jgi:hypothetical protein